MWNSIACVLTFLASQRNGHILQVHHCVRVIVSFLSVHHGWSAYVLLMLFLLACVQFSPPKSVTSHQWQTSMAAGQPTQLYCYLPIPNKATQHKIKPHSNTERQTLCVTHNQTGNQYIPIRSSHTRTQCKQAVWTLCYPHISIAPSGNTTRAKNIPHDATASTTEQSVGLICQNTQAEPPRTAAMATNLS